MVVEQNKTVIDGDDLLDALVRHVAFDGVTGAVAFVDSSSTDLKNHGDRKADTFGYKLLNYADISQGWVEVGRWAPCGTSDGCALSSMWSPHATTPMTLSTADNSWPLQAAGCSGTAEILKNGLCVCDRGYERQGSFNCVACQAGLAKNVTGDSPCDPCGVGTVTPTSAHVTCIDCPIGFYQPSAMSSECIKCSFPASALPGSGACDVCAATTYRVNTALPPTAQNCHGALLSL